MLLFERALSRLRVRWQEIPKKIFKGSGLRVAGKGVVCRGGARGERG